MEGHLTQDGAALLLVDSLDLQGKNVTCIFKDYSQYQIFVSANNRHI